MNGTKKFSASAFQLLQVHVHAMSPKPGAAGASASPKATFGPAISHRFGLRTPAAPPKRP